MKPSRDMAALIEIMAGAEARAYEHLTSVGRRTARERVASLLMELLLRARQKIKDERTLLEEPHAEALTQRLGAVHKVLYLIFNEGYKASWGKEILREELCEEALLMTRALQESPLAGSDTARDATARV